VGTPNINIRYFGSFILVFAFMVKMMIGLCLLIFSRKKASSFKAVMNFLISKQKFDKSFYDNKL